MEIFWIVTGVVTGVTFLGAWAVDRRPKIAAAVALVVGGTLGVGGMAVDLVVPDAPPASVVQEGFVESDGAKAMDVTAKMLDAQDIPYDFVQVSPYQPSEDTIRVRIVMEDGQFVDANVALIGDGFSVEFAEDGAALIEAAKEAGQ